MIINLYVRLSPVPYFSFKTLTVSLYFQSCLLNKLNFQVTWTNPLGTLSSSTAYLISTRSLTSTHSTWLVKLHYSYTVYSSNLPDKQSFSQNVSVSVCRLAQQLDSYSSLLSSLRTHLGVSRLPVAGCFHKRQWYADRWTVGYCSRMLPCSHRAWGLLEADGVAAGEGRKEEAAKKCSSH